ncbi:MAG: helix-turn-helix transcriptional regulator [Firmicutes bacterium]|nr:helix-turn-helix transcriptional regulator [Bacillota bacterium]
MVQELKFWESVIPPEEKFYVWCYDEEGILQSTSCPEDMRTLLDQAFHLLEGYQKARSSMEPVPVLIGSSLGMQWAVTYEKEHGHDLMYVMGPVFYTLPTASQIRQVMRHSSWRTEDIRWENEMIRRLEEMPVLPFAIFVRYVLLVHNVLHGTQLGLEAVLVKDTVDSSKQPMLERQRDRGQVYQAEQAMLRMVREGNISYHSVLQNSMKLSPGVPVQGTDPLRQMKTSIVVFATLVSRAAIEGGLSPDVAYPLGDSYIQAAEDCRDSGELTAMANTMYHDFIYRVHQLRQDPRYSRTIQRCCDLIELSLEREISLRDLAQLAGYSEYYLSEKFKKETGLSVNRYIQQARIDRAKVLLESTNKSIREIAEQLTFSSVNYFIRVFRETTGQTPTQYRREMMKEKILESGSYEDRDHSL